MPGLRTYDDVPVSGLAVDPGAGWAAIDRRIVVDLVALVERVARVIAPDYRAPGLPDPLVFETTQITSDGPYGSDENYYFLDWCTIELDGLSLHFEDGRHGGGESLVLETKGLEWNVTAVMAPVAMPAAKARVFVWHEPVDEAAVRAALGI